MALVRGQLAAVDVAGTGTLTDIYTVPASKVADINLNIANRSDTNTSLRIAHIKNGTASGVSIEDYILYDLPTSIFVSNFSPLEKTAILMSAGDTIAVYSSASAVTVQINGIEEDVT